MKQSSCLFRRKYAVYIYIYSYDFLVLYTFIDYLSSTSTVESLKILIHFGAIIVCVVLFTPSCNPGELQK